jgi:hypothetical protein
MSEFSSWNEMSELEQARTTWWDAYKDAYGFRPRGINTSSWSLEDFNKELELLGATIQQGEAARREDEARAVVKFTKRIQDVIEAGAGDRETALRWIHDADGANGDWEYLCYLNGLPYNYFAKS